MRCFELRTQTKGTAFEKTPLALTQSRTVDRVQLYSCTTHSVHRLILSHTHVCSAAQCTDDL